MKSITLLTLYLGHLIASFGQTPKSGTELSSLIKLDGGGQGIGLTYEPRLSNNMTVDISAGVGGGYYIDGGTFELNYLTPVKFPFVNASMTLFQKS